MAPTRPYPAAPLTAPLWNVVAWRAIYLILQSGPTLLLFVVLAQLLPPSEFAVAAVAMAIIVVAQALGELGLGQAALTTLPAMSADELPAHITGVVRAFGVAAAVAAAIDVAAAFAVPAAARTAALLCAPAASATVVVSAADALLRALGEVRTSTRLVLIARAGGFAAIPVAAVSDDGTLTCLALSLGTVAGSVPALATVVTRVPGGRADWHVARVALPLGLSQLFVVAGGRLNTVLVGAIASLRAAAAFEAAWRLYQFGLYSVGAMATGAAPLLGSASRPGAEVELCSLLRRLSIVAAALGVAAGTVLFLAAPRLGDLLFPAIGSEVGDALRTLSYVCPVTFLGALAAVSLAVSRRGRGLILGWHAAGAITGLPLVVVLARDEGAPGAAAGCGVGLLITYVPLTVELIRWQMRLRAVTGDARGDERR